MEGKLLGLLGLARRGGLLCFGFDAVLKAVAEGRAYAVLLARDASERTARGVERCCCDAGLEPLHPEVDMEALGNAIGRNETAVVAVLNRSLADRVKTLCTEFEEE